MKPQSSLKKSPAKAPAERVVKDIRQQTRRHFSAEDKIRIVLDGLRGDDSIAELCRKGVQATIEELMGLPNGSVRFVTPDGRTVRSDAMVRTLWMHWGE